MNYWRFMRKFNLTLALVLLLSCNSLADYQIKSDDVRVDTSHFTGILSSADDTLQKALETIDDYVAGESSGFWGHISGTITEQTDLMDYLSENYQTKSSSTITECLTFIISGNGSVIAASASGHKVVPYACTVTGWEVTSSASGSIVIDIKRATYSGMSFSSIAGTEKPTISTSTKGADLSLSTWTTSLAAGDRIQALVDSADINGIVVLTIYLQRS